MNYKELVKRCLLCFLLSTYLYGCVSIPAHKLPQYTAEQIPAPSKKIAASYVVKGFYWTGENQRWNATLYQEIHDVLQQNNDFDLVTSDKVAGGYHISFYFRTEADGSNLSQISAILSTFTLGVLPGHWRMNYSLVVEVRQGEEPIKYYVYQDQTSEWMQILLLPVALIHPPQKTHKAVFDHMLRNFVHDFMEDQHSGVLAKKNNAVSLPVKPDQDHAMIYIIRPSMYDTQWRTVIHLDGKGDNAIMGYNHGSQYIYFSVDPGEHTILSQNMNTNTWIATSVDAAKGEAYFFSQDWVAGQGGERFRFTKIDAREAMAELLLAQPGTMRTDQGE